MFPLPSPGGGGGGGGGGGVGGVGGGGVIDRCIMIITVCTHLCMCSFK